MLCILKVCILAALSLVVMPARLTAAPNSEAMDQADMRSKNAVTQAKRLNQDSDYKRKLRHEREHAMTAAGEAVHDAPPSIAQHCTGKDCPVVDPETLVKAKEDIKQLLANPQLAGLENSLHDDNNPRPLIFISFSMPADSLRSLFAEAAITGAPLVLRGLVENSMKRTMARLGELLGIGNSTETASEPTPSLAIDPTLFDRFNIDKVPTFVLPLDAIAACTPDGCPVPEYLKVAGDVSLAYALGVMVREAGGTPLGRHAGQWRQRLETRP